MKLCIKNLWKTIKDILIKPAINLFSELGEMVKNWIVELFNIQE